MRLNKNSELIEFVLQKFQESHIPLNIEIMSQICPAVLYPTFEERLPPSPSSSSLYTLVSLHREL